MGSEVVRADGDWLALREPADAAARAPELVETLKGVLPTGRRLVVHDLGAGTGAMTRWLAPRLLGPQRWVLHERDASLLAPAATSPPPVASDGSAVSVETRLGDITQLPPDVLRDADLLTASALLDMMSASGLERFVTSCARAGCPILVTLSVVGVVELTPSAELDREVMDAFNAHQRRGKLLGPDASAAAVAELEEVGFEVTARPSPWRLGPDMRGLATEWFTGWVGAAVEQRPELTRAIASYTRARLAEAAAGSLSVTVHHVDLLAVPRGSARRCQ